MNKLLQPVAIGNVVLANRLAMAPMTRCRSTPDGVPTALNATYYGQRGSFGLIISEGTQPSEDGQGYFLTPGIHNAAQIAGWKLVSDAVHESGAKFFIQLMHVGRIAHPANTPHGRQSVAPSAVRAAGKMYTASGPQDMPEPRQLSAEDIATTIDDFRKAAACAIESGADGVEIHAANGYLIHQFLSENANRRMDAYGLSLVNRVRFALEVATAIADEIGPERTGIHISPGNPFNDIVEGDTAGLYKRLLSELTPLKLAYLHLVHAGDENLLKSIRSTWTSSLIVNRAGRPREEVARDVDSGGADVASVGKFALANPDFIARLKVGAPLNEPDPATFYVGGERGYIDYPMFEAQAQPA